MGWAVPTLLLIQVSGTGTPAQASGHVVAHVLLQVGLLEEESSSPGQPPTRAPSPALQTNAVFHHFSIHHVPSAVLWEGNKGLSSPCCLRQHFRLQPELRFTTRIDCSSGLLLAARGANNTL